MLLQETDKQSQQVYRTVDFPNDLLSSFVPFQPVSCFNSSSTPNRDRQEQIHLPGLQTKSSVRSTRRL